MGRNHRSTPGGAGVDPQRGGAAKKNLDPYLTPKGDEPMRTLLEASRYAAMVLPGDLVFRVKCYILYGIWNTRPARAEENFDPC